MDSLIDVKVEADNPLQVLAKSTVTTKSNGGSLSSHLQGRCYFRSVAFASAASTARIRSPARRRTYQAASAAAACTERSPRCASKNFRPFSKVYRPHNNLNLIINL